MSTRLIRLRQPHPGSSGMKERDMEDTIQVLEARVAMLESQKGALQNKLSLAKQHIMDLGGRPPYKFSKGVCVRVCACVCVYICVSAQMDSSLTPTPPFPSHQVRVWKWRAESGGPPRLLHLATAPCWKTPRRRWRNCKCAM